MGPSPHGVDGSPVVKGLGAPDLCFLSLRHALGCPHTEQQRSSLKPQNTGIDVFVVQMATLLCLNFPP